MGLDSWHCSMLTKGTFTPEELHGFVPSSAKSHSPFCITSACLYEAAVGYASAAHTHATACILHQAQPTLS